MKSYSQNGEDLIIYEYFRSIDLASPRLLDLGANDGITLSNSRLLLETGRWSGVLVEPSNEAFSRLTKNSVGFPVTLLKLAIGQSNGTVEFMESGVHLPNGTDIALLSTISSSDYEKWKSTTSWKKYSVEVVDISTLFERVGTGHFDFVTMDIEGMDLIALKQMDLTQMGVRCICVEHNSKEVDRYIDHCTKHGLTEISRNAENSIFVRQ